MYRGHFATCPNCHVELEKAGLANRAFRRCPTCAGGWLDHGTMKRMVTAMEMNARLELLPVTDRRDGTGAVAVGFDVVEDGRGLGRFIYSRAVINIGRDESCDLRINHRHVDPLHAVIDIAALDDVRLTDWGSVMGTRVNGQRTGSWQLRNGDTIEIGPYAFTVSLLEDVERAPVRRRPCLECHEPMQLRNIEQIAVDVCPEHGLWFDARELAQVLERLASGD